MKDLKLEWECIFHKDSLGNHVEEEQPGEQKAWKQSPGCLKKRQAEEWGRHQKGTSQKIKSIQRHEKPSVCQALC